MKHLFLASAMAAGGLLLVAPSALGHGGTYPGPGDTTPPGGGGGGGSAGPSSPGPSGPSAPGPSGPATPSPGAPTTPGGSPAAGGGASGPMSGVTGGSATPDLTQWTFWWAFNKHPYIQLKAKVHAGTPVSGTDDWFLGHGATEDGKNSMAPSEAQIRQTVVPALLAALENETSNDIVTGCLIALAKIGDANVGEQGESELEKVIAKFLADSNQEISETAAIALGILANPASIGTLESLVSDDSFGRKLVGRSEVSYRTRAFAAYGLGLIGQSASVEDRQAIVRILWDVLRTDRSSTRDLRVAALVALGLVVPWPEPHDPARPAGALAAPHESPRALVDALLAYLRDTDQEYLVRAHVPVTLARLCERLAAPEERALVKETVARDLVARLDARRSKEPNEVLQSCVIALGLLGDCDSDATDDAIRRALFEHGVADTQTRYFTPIALAHAGGAKGEGTEPFGRALDKIRSHLLRGLGARNPEERAWFGLALGVLEDELSDDAMRDASVATALREALRDAKNPSEVGALAIALGILDDDDDASVDAVRDKLQAVRDDEARGYCCVALGLMDARETVEDIQGIVEQSQYRADLLREAAIALGMLGDKPTVDTLIGMLRRAQSLATQASLSAALGHIGDSRSILPLVEMLGDESLTERARGFAAAALGIVADKGELPWSSGIGVDLNYRATTETLNDPQGTGILNLL